MLTNEQMKPGRFLRQHEARRRYNWIMSRFDAGLNVQLGTYTRTIRCAPKHRDMFRLTRTDVLLQRGKNWDSIMLCSLHAYRA